MAHTTRTETLDSLYASTWDYVRDEVIDAVFTKQPFWGWLYDKGNVERVNHGKKIRTQLEVEVNTTVTELSTYGEVDLTGVDPFTVALYDWGTVAGNIRRNRDDDTENTGKAQIFNLLNKKKKNLSKSMAKSLEVYTFRAEDSTPAGGINSLRDLVDDNPTSSKTVGGYDQSNNAWWQNQTRAAQGAASLFLRKDMQLLYNDIEEATDEAPDIIVCNRSQYEVYEDELLDMNIINDQKMADLGYTDHLVFKGTPMVKSPQCPSTSLWMLNSDYLYFTIHPALDFAMTDWKEITNQPFNKVAQIVTKGQLTCSHRGAQGQLHTITYS